MQIKVAVSTTKHAQSLLLDYDARTLLIPSHSPIALDRMSSQSVFLDRARQTLQHPSAPYRASRRAPLDVPERLRDVRDADTDVTAPRTKKGQYLNQSFLTMIANAGSNATFRPPLDATSLVEDKGEEEVEEEQAEKEEEVDEEEGSRFEMQYQDTAGVLPAENYMAQSLPGLKPVSLASRRMHQTTVHDDSVLTSQILVRPTEQPEVVPDLGSQEDDAGRHPLNSGEEDHAIDDEPVGDCVSSESKEDDTLAFRIPKVPGQDLARRVAQIFQFGEEEEVIASMPNYFSLSLTSTNPIRVSLLVASECYAPGNDVYHNPTHLFLCDFTNAIG